MADHVCCFCGFEMVNSGMRRNLWSAANSEIIQSLIYIVGKAKFMETSVLEGELNKWKHICRFCVTALSSYRKKERDLLAKAANTPVRSSDIPATSHQIQRKRPMTTSSLIPPPKRVLFARDSQISSPPVAVSSKQYALIHQFYCYMLLFIV